MSSEQSKATLTAMQDLAYAYPRLTASAVIRQQAEDFQVDEQLGFELSGEGEHAYVLLRKRGQNTQWLVRHIAQYCSVPIKQVAYAGLKDRHAVTSQWFSVHLPGKETPAWSTLENDHVQLLAAQRHHKKLRRGALQANMFNIRLRDVKVDAQEVLLARLQAIKENGVPNYFGEQRFGRHGENVDKAQAMFARRFRPKRDEKSLLLSAVRAFLFNRVLSARVAQGNWADVLAGDVLMLAGSNSVFASTDEDAIELSQRLQSLALHTTGPLYGDGSGMVSAAAAELETSILSQYPELLAGLEQHKLEFARRALRLVPMDFAWQFAGRDLLLTFALRPGSYATAVLREILDYHVAQPDY